MKKMVCFFRAYLTSIIMFVAANFFLIFSTDMLPLVSAQAGLLILQCISIIKCTAILVVVMPGRLNIKQTVFGFIAADISIVVVNIALSNVAVFPMPIIIAQSMLVIYHLGTRGLLPVYEPSPTVITMNTELITGTI